MKLSDYVELNPRVPLVKGQTVPFVAMDVVTPGNRWVRPEEQRPATGSGSKFAPGDTLFARITPCLENGKIAQYAGGRPGMGSTEFFVLRARAKISDPAFVFYFSQNRDLRSSAEKSMSGASGRQRADISSLSEFECEFPPLPVQRQIAGILSAYDELIENCQRRIQILEAMARALYREWFVHFRFPGHEKVKMVESPLGKIPQGWEPKTLGDIAQEVRRGVSPDQIDPDTPYIGLEHMPRKSIALWEWGTAEEVQSTKLAFKKGEILFGKIRPYFHKVGVAAVDGVCSTDAIVIVPKSPELFPLLLGCVSSEEFVSHATQTSQGTKMPRANWDVLVKYPMSLPPPAILSQFDEFISNAVTLIHNLLFKNRNLRRTRDLLLPKLISGEIDVSELGIETNGKM